MTGTAGMIRISGNRRECRIVKKNYRLNVPVLPQPVGLRLEVPVDDIAFLILDTPGNDNDGIAFAYPLSLLYLSLDPAHAGDAINTLDTDVICPHHCFGTGKLLVVPFFGQTYTADRRTIRV